MPANIQTIEPDNIILDYRSETKIRSNEYDDECEYNCDINADIVGELTHPTKSQLTKEILLGRLHLIRIHVSNACNDGVDLYEIFDERQETWKVSEALFAGSFDEFRPTVEKMFPDSFAWNDIMIINRIEVFPLARGKNLGANAIHQAVRDFGGGCSIVILKAFPLQFEGKASTKPHWAELNLGAFSQNQKEATMRLAAYYKRMGFRKIGKTLYYAACMESKVFLGKNRPSLQPISIPKSVFDDATIPWMEIE
jgi:hypothetical protein